MKSIAEIEKKVQDKENVLNKICRLDRMKLSGHLEIDDIDFIDNERLRLIESIGHNKQTPFELVEKLLNEYDLDIEQVIKARYKYIHDNFIIENEITMIAGAPGNGKSLIPNYAIAK